MTDKAPLSEKDPAEVVPVTFEFAGTVTPTSPVISVSVAKGKADTGTAAMVVGSPTITGSTVIQLFGGGIDGNDYLLTCQVDDGSERYINSCILPVRTSDGK